MDVVRARVGWSWLVALVITCALAVQSRPSAGPPARSGTGGRARLVPSPWPAIRHDLVRVWVVAERGVDGFVETFLDRPGPDPLWMREPISELRARRRVLQRRLVELKREMAERARHRCGNWYEPDPFATSTLDVTRGR